MSSSRASLFFFIFVFILDKRPLHMIDICITSHLSVLRIPASWLNLEYIPLY
jgi:hypothetical protein